MNAQKRKQAMEEQKITRQKAQDAANEAHTDDDTSVLDNLLEKLRNGDASVSRRARRPRPSAENRPPLPALNIDGPPAGGDDTAEIARDMLARLQSDGFQAFVPGSPSVGAAARRQTRRRRAGNNLSMSGMSDLELASPDPESTNLPDLPDVSVLAEPAYSQATDSEAET